VPKADLWAERRVCAIPAEYLDHVWCSALVTPEHLFSAA
jgi:hypothetical protein